jgi:quinol-cytochrome oxidoreductase complex cytochrome b subunit
MARRLIVLILVLLPQVAAACPSCLATPYGDRTFNWAFLGLILMPFVVAAAIGGVLFYLYRPPRMHRAPQRPLEETT